MGDSELKDHIKIFLDSLLTTSTFASYRVSNTYPDSSRYLSIEEANKIAAIPSILEIKAPRFEFKPFKAPGPDVLHPLFFFKNIDIWTVTPWFSLSLESFQLKVLVKIIMILPLLLFLKVIAGGND